MTVGADRVRAALARVAARLGAPDVEFGLERPREDAHGDLATNLALQLARPLRRKPRAIADEIVAALDLPADVVTRVEIAGPGFINFFLAETAVAGVLDPILAAGAAYGRADIGHGVRVNVEFVSANPTGPLHVGNGRGAALGDAIASLLEATGHAVTREFYVNDAGVQIGKLARSLWARLQQATGREVAVPEGGYHGAYLEEMATSLLAEHPGLADRREEEILPRLESLAMERMRAEQDRDLADFGVHFDVYASERAIYDTGKIDATLEALKEHDLVFEEDGALWLATSRFGDDKDRVIRKRDGTYTYFLPDIAYHRDKAERGFARAIDVWGADHHGYVARMRAALTGLGLGETFFDVVIVQLVKVTRGGEEVRFSKRAGDIITLRELFEETGVDAARYFFLQRKGDSQFVFDVDLAKRQTEENPVYYVQYAHTRMAGIFRTADLVPQAIVPGWADPSPLTDPSEQELMKRLAEYPAIVRKAAEALEPHRVIAYLEDLARLVNVWYHRCRVVGEAPAVQNARLLLARAAQVVLANGLGLMGVSAPERM